jgi:hypothetical protein
MTYILRVQLTALPSSDYKKVVVVVTTLKGTSLRIPLIRLQNEYGVLVSIAVNIDSPPVSVHLEPPLPPSEVVSLKLTYTQEVYVTFAGKEEVSLWKS